MTDTIPALRAELYKKPKFRPMIKYGEKRWAFIIEAHAVDVIERINSLADDNAALREQIKLERKAHNDALKKVTAKAIEVGFSQRETIKRYEKALRDIVEYDWRAGDVRLGFPARMLGKCATIANEALSPPATRDRNVR